MSIDSGNGATTGPPAEVPAVVLDVELSRPLPSVASHDDRGRRVRQAWLVVRLFTEPLAVTVVDIPADGLAPTDVLDATVTAGGERLAASLKEIGRTTADISVQGVPTPDVVPYLLRRDQALPKAPTATVAICTRERAEGLRLCLEGLVRQSYRVFTVVVVDNAPESDRTRLVVEEFADRLRIQYEVEPRPGLSRARNHALASLTSEVVAWLDDDEIPDEHWVAEILTAFVENPHAAAVSGVVVPAELETEAQVLFERFGGHSKGRGFKPDVFSPDTASVQNPLYPVPPFGVGANMAFAVKALRSVDGFDEALGAGTPAKGAEDTLIFTELLLAGHTTVYHPSALVRHYHRREMEGLTAQMYGYGTGLTGAYTALLLRNPRVLWPLARLAPQALRDLRSAESPINQGLGEDFPQELLAVKRRGMRQGPRLYLRGRRLQRREQRSAATR